MQTHQSIHLFSKLPIDMQTYQFIYFQNYQSTCKPINSSIFKTTNLQADLSIYLFSKLPIYKHTYQLIYFQNYQSHANLSIHLFQNYQSTWKPINSSIFKTSNIQAYLSVDLFSKLPIHMQTYYFIFFQNYQSTCRPINSSIFKTTNLHPDLSIHLFLKLAMYNVHAYLSIHLFSKVPIYRQTYQFIYFYF